MDPLSPATSTLAPAIAHIAETSLGLADELAKDGALERSEEQRKKDKQLRLVQRVITAPTRLKELMDDGRLQEAENEWKHVQKALHRWDHVPGASSIRERCEEIMDRLESD
jgi:hypothetical protein